MANEEYPFCPKCKEPYITYSEYAIIRAPVNFIRNRQRVDKRIDTEEWEIDESDTPFVIEKPFTCDNCGEIYNMNQLGFTDVEPE